MSGGVHDCPMILSRRHRFILIKGRKVGGTSAEIALTSFCGDEDIVTPINTVDERSRMGARNWAMDRDSEGDWLASVRAGGTHRPSTYLYWNHMSLQQVERQCPEDALRSYMVLFVERSPYAKVLSGLNWLLRSAEYTGRPMTSTPEEVQARFNESVIHRWRNIHRYRWANGQLAGQPWRIDRAAAGGRRARSEPDKPGSACCTCQAGNELRGELDPAQWLSRSQLDCINDVFADEFDAFGYPRL